MTLPHPKVTLPTHGEYPRLRNRYHSSATQLIVIHGTRWSLFDPTTISASFFTSEDSEGQPEPFPYLRWSPSSVRSAGKDGKERRTGAAERRGFFSLLLSWVLGLPWLPCSWGRWGLKFAETVLHYRNNFPSFPLINENIYSMITWFQMVLF